MISLVLSAVLMAGAPAAAEAAPAAAPAKSEKVEKPNKDGLVCRKEPVIGSRMKSRICLTQQEWDARQAADRELLEQAQRGKPLQGN